MVQLLVFFCSSVPVVLFDTPGISRCRSHGLENLHADQTTVCFEPWQKPRARLGSRKTGLSPSVFFTDRSKAVLLLWFIFLCYHNMYNVCLLYDCVATLRLSALPSALYFVLSKLAL